MLEAYAALNEQFPAVFLIISFVFGAIVGSFLNVCIYRIPEEKSVVTPGSHCSCGKPIAWYDNIPIVSWILLRGRARCCGRPFSIRYPFIELLTGVLFLICWWSFSPLVAFCGMFFCALLICATFIDFDHMIIPDRFTIGGAVAGVVLSILVPALHGFDSGVLLLDNLRAGLASIVGLLIGSAVVLWIALLAEIV
ncbi:MAG TPA: prepilin peptidase, partial [Opitutales bacterium]|nr:prepilin peptidase [Opitutales bacterium]